MREIYDYPVDGFDAYLADLGVKDVLTPADEHELAVRVTAGDTLARQSMIEHNLRLVINIARSFHQFDRVDVSELVAEGNVGLVVAVDKFDPMRVDPVKGTYLKFSTYAIWWIKQAMSRYLHRINDPVHIPDHLQEKRFKVKRTIIALRLQLGREPTIAEIVRQSKLPQKTVEQVQRIGEFWAISLDMPLDDTEHPLETILSNTVSRSAYDQVEDKDLVTFLSSTLPPVEYEVILDRFGLADREELDVVAIAHKRHVTRQYIDLVYKRALKRLRETSGSYLTA